LNIVVEDRKADPPIAVGGLEGIDKRVGSRGKKKSKRKNKKGTWGEHQRIDIRRSIRKGGLTVIEKRVGSRGKKVKEKEKPMDCVPWVFY
jgi:hypothetical protein